MAFQTTVSFQQGFGVPGARFNNAPWKAESFIINSASAAYNIIGATGFTISSQGNAQAGNPSGTAVYAGILAAPKQQALYGTTAGGTLAPSLTLPNYSQADIVSEGNLIVTLGGSGTVNIGDLVVFDNTTGALSTVSPTTTLPSGKSWAYAVVDYYTITAPGLAVIRLNPTIVFP